MSQADRELRKSDYRRGMFMTMDAPGVVAMQTDAGVLTMKSTPVRSPPPESDAQRQAREKAEWNKRFEEKYLRGW